MNARRRSAAALHDVQSPIADLSFRSSALRRELAEMERETIALVRPGVALVDGDALDALSRFPTGSIDLIFADPPYLLSNGGTTCSGGERAPVDKGEWDRSAGLARDHQFHRSWLRVCQRLLSARGTLWVSGTQHAIFTIGWAMQSMGWEILNCVTWYKPAAAPNLGCRQLTHSCEFVIWAAPAPRRPMQHTFNYRELRAANGGKQVRDFWMLERPPASETRHGKHPTQKPRELLRRILRAASRPGDTVLEPFAGSAPAGVVARELGRCYVGIDRDPASFRLAQSNLELE